MTMTFWSIAVGLIALALLFVIPPFFKRKFPSNVVEQQHINIAIYKERVAELEKEELTREQFEQAKLELDQTLLQEAGPPAELAAQPRARWASVIILICLPIFVVGGYFLSGRPEFLNPQAQMAKGHNKELPSVNEMVAKLEARLAQNPDDLEGWKMLARTYGFMQHYDKAIPIYNKLLSLGADKDPNILSDYAEALANLNNHNLRGQPSILLKTALDIDPSHQKSLWLAGVAATQQDENEEAVKHWTKLLNQIPETDAEARQTLQTYIQKAQQLIDGIATPVTKNNTVSVPEADTPKLTVTVTLAKELQDKMKSTDTLFIYARATTGSPMPLAIVRKTASELPISVTLDDSQAMLPNKRLSLFKEVTVVARISEAGSAVTQSGDLIGQVDSVALETTNTSVEVLINQVAP